LGGGGRGGLLMCSPTYNALSFWIESLIYERKRKQKKVGGMVDKKEEIKALICGFPKSEVLTLESLGKTQGNTQCIFIYLFFQKIKNLHLKQ
jgi:hypothetical protein